MTQFESWRVPGTKTTISYRLRVINVVSVVVKWQNGVYGRQETRRKEVTSPVDGLPKASCLSSALAGVISHLGVHNVIRFVCYADSELRSFGVRSVECNVPLIRQVLKDFFHVIQD
jgi:hypothetical protein